MHLHTRSRTCARTCALTRPNTARAYTSAPSTRTMHTTRALHATRASCATRTIRTSCATRIIRITRTTRACITHTHIAPCTLADTHNHVGLHSCRAAARIPLACLHAGACAYMRGDEYKSTRMRIYAIWRRVDMSAHCYGTHATEYRTRLHGRIVYAHRVPLCTCVFVRNRARIIRA